MFKVIETFSGIGSQAQALKNIGIDFSVEAIVEWEIAAMYAYDIIHNGPQNLSKYRHHTRESLIQELSKYNISNDGKQPISNRSLSAMNILQLKAILASIERNNNFVDITAVHAKDLPETDLLTYSFPCQDLSISSYWHKNFSGIDREANNRSTLLWQIERLLIEYQEEDKELPKFLLMENVSNILSEKHIHNFNEWCDFLQNLGYVNQVYTLDARNFGVPQSRVRTYMISVLADSTDTKNRITNYFFENDLERQQMDSSQINPISNYLRLDYNNEIYRKEAIESTPVYTASRKKIHLLNRLLANGDIPDNSKIARTVTTKQDRHPNSGIIEYGDKPLVDTNTEYRNLTPRECFLLMGFDESSYNNLINNNITVQSERKLLSTSKLIRLAGNSIVVQVLEAIFKQMIEIDNTILKTDTKIYQ
ncbi:DNA (cytosine-5-)-methyltransferase [Staphylococcus simulans]|uniref:DNA (cytosine-5-)-methyltransferase n=1 Tax=Staphylococcus simulans TaxID=1286 RepID=UPI000E68DEEB|nr:DNA (cytosine-5-)-methyltransferase [Staphylococcus simulans]RIN55582.1 DNA (cytosine-5-)-methyltransferase [Staphylococcus simulans]